MKSYHWQNPNWPHFVYDMSGLEPDLLNYSERIAAFRGIASAVNETFQKEFLTCFMVSEALKTSEIEGDFVSRIDVQSSIMRYFGSTSTPPIKDKRAEGVSRLIWDVRKRFKGTLSQEMLWEWHTMLFSGVSSSRHLDIGQWRTSEEPMRIISGVIGKLKVHYEAPPAAQVPAEMTRYIDWFNATAPGQPQEIFFPPIRAAIAHLYFESIHPFEDGNGRIGRALAEKVLSQGSDMYAWVSLSEAIMENRKQYYAALKEAQTSLTITKWVHFFVKLIIEPRKKPKNM